MTDIHDLTRKLQRKNDSKIVLLVADGLGGLPREPGGKTELESAWTPNFDELTQRGVLGLSTPVLPGITPGSGPGHLGLFGYDPLKYVIGRGVLEGLGIDFDLGPDDVAIRGNFCTIDDEGKITDRRAGRIGSDVGAALCEKLDRIEIPGVEAPQGVTARTFDLIARQTFPFADVEFAQQRIQLGTKVVRFSNDRGGLDRATEIARNDYVNRFVGELSSKRARLHSAAIGERRIPVPLPATLRVPGRLGVPDQQQ